MSRRGPAGCGGTWSGWEGFLREEREILLSGFIFPSAWGIGDSGGGNKEGSIHPHACGELDANIKILEWCIGSSLHRWGTLGDHAIATARRRFIPTYVGNS